MLDVKGGCGVVLLTTQHTVALCGCLQQHVVALYLLTIEHTVALSLLTTDHAVALGLLTTEHVVALGLLTTELFLLSKTSASRVFQRIKCISEYKLFQLLIIINEAHCTKDITFQLLLIFRHQSNMTSSLDGSTWK